jgi:micrococcal nuclease
VVLSANLLCPNYINRWFQASNFDPGGVREGNDGGPILLRMTRPAQLHGRRPVQWIATARVVARVLATSLFLVSVVPAEAAGSVARGAALETGVGNLAGWRTGDNREREEHGRVVWVHDGDTVTVRLGSRREKVRLIGIDTAELEDRRPWWRDLARRSRDYARERLRGQDVTLLRDARCTDRDDYGRLLRYVMLPNGVDFNLEMIRKGYARAYTRFAFSRRKEFLAAERKAKRARVERWGGGEGSATSGGSTSRIRRPGSVFPCTPRRASA